MVAKLPRCSCTATVQPGKRRPRLSFGSLRVLPSGRHQARYTGPDGKRYDAPITFDTHAAAEQWLSTVRAAMVTDSWKPPTVRSLTLREYSEKWLEQRNLKPRTADHYRQLLDHFLLPDLGDLPLKAITPEVVRNWYHRLVTGPTYKAHAYSLLRTITRTAVDDRLIPASPCVIRGAGSVKRAVKIKPATLGDLENIVAAMPERLRLLVLLAAWCAMRFGELAELRRKDIDVKAGVIRIRRGVTWVDGVAIVGAPKSTAGIRDVAIPPHLLPLVKAHLRDHAQWGADGLIFPTARGGQMTSATLYDYWWPARDAAGRSDLRFHDLRHTGAVLAAQTGATLAELMARLGHSTASAAMRYQHAAQGRDAEIAAKLSEIAEGKQ